jgi:hypothetical protein
MIKGLLSYIYYEYPRPFVELPRELVLKILLIVAETNEKLIYETIGQYPGYLRRYRETIDSRFLVYKNFNMWQQFYRRAAHLFVTASLGYTFHFRGGKSLAVGWEGFPTYCTVKERYLRGTKRMIGKAKPFFRDGYVCLRVELRHCYFTPTDIGLERYYFTRDYDVVFDREYRIVRIRYTRTKHTVFIVLEAI